MRSILMYGMAVAFVFASSALATPTITLDNYVLLPNHPTWQPIDIFVTGGDAVEALNFNVEVGAGGPPIADLVILNDTAPGPSIPPVYVFDQNNNGPPFDLDGPHPDVAPLWEGRSTTTQSGTVPADGLLATIFFDTSGMGPGGPWPLMMSSTVNGPTDFGPILADITDGTVRIAGGEPEFEIAWDPNGLDTSVKSVVPGDSLDVYAHVDWPGHEGESFTLDQTSLSWWDGVLDPVDLIASPGDVHAVSDWFLWGQVEVGDNLPGTTISLQADIIAPGVFDTETLSNTLQMNVIPEPATLLVWSLLAAVGITFGCHKRWQK